MADIFDITANSNNFKTLIDAVKATELVEILKKSGPFTVFAPSDDAFAKMPLITVINLWANLPQFKQFLTCHVVSGKLMKADLKNVKAVSSIEGRPIPINFANGFSVNDITVITADIEADNGVIHVIDEVIFLSKGIGNKTML